MAHPQPIQIFLPSGDPQGIRVAAATLYGRSSNGWMEWKGANGRTLSDVMGRNKPTEGAEG